MGYRQRGRRRRSVNVPAGKQGHPSERDRAVVTAAIGQIRHGGTPTPRKDRPVVLRVEKTPRSLPGRPEHEVFAPDGYSFGGPHSLIIRGSREMAASEGAGRPLIRCDRTCGCGYSDAEDE